MFPHLHLQLHIHSQHQFCNCNMCQLVFGKIYMVLRDGHCFRFKILARLPSTKYGIRVYPIRCVRWVHYQLEIIFVLVFGGWTTLFHFNLAKVGVSLNKIGWRQGFHQLDLFGVLLITCIYHITFVAIDKHTKQRNRTIACTTNIMLVHCEFFTDVSIVEEHGIGSCNCHSTLWPKSLCQSHTMSAPHANKGERMHSQYAIDSS